MKVTFMINIEHDSCDVSEGGRGECGSEERGAV